VNTVGRICCYFLLDSSFTGTKFLLKNSFRWSYDFCGFVGVLRRRRCADNDDSARPPSYLRDEYLRRLDSGTAVTFCLQAQFHDVKPSAADDAGAGGKPGDSWWYNPTSAWFSSAWIDLASLSFYSPLPVDAMSFSAERVPAPAVAIRAPSDETDFNSVAAVEAAMEAERMAIAVSKEAAAVEDMQAGGDDASVEMTDYLVYCVTGDRINAGTSADIHISIVGKLDSLCNGPFNNHARLFGPIFCLFLPLVTDCHILLTASQ